MLDSTVLFGLAQGPVPWHLALDAKAFEKRHAPFEIEVGLLLDGSER